MENYHMKASARFWKKNGERRSVLTTMSAASDPRLVASDVVAIMKESQDASRDDCQCSILSWVLTVHNVWLLSNPCAQTCTDKEPNWLVASWFCMTNDMRITNGRESAIIICTHTSSKNIHGASLGSPSWSLITHPPSFTQDCAPTNVPPMSVWIYIPYVVILRKMESLRFKNDKIRHPTNR